MEPIKGASFYVPVLLGGALVAKQMSKLPYAQQIYENAFSLEQRVVEGLQSFAGFNENLANLTVNTSESLIGASLLCWLAHRVKKSKKKRDFRKFVKADRHQKIETGLLAPSEENGISRLRKFAGYTTASVREISSGVGFATKHAVAITSAGFLLASGFLFPHAYDYVAGHAQELIARGGQVLEQICSNPVVKAGAGLLTVEAGSRIYSCFTHAKHGPILKRIYVNGFIPPVERVHLNRIRALRPLGIESDKTRGMDDRLIWCAKITVKDYTKRWGHRKKRMWMAYRDDIEPKRVERRLSVEGVEAVLDYLKERVEASPGEEDITDTSFRTCQACENVRHLSSY